MYRVSLTSTNYLRQKRRCNLLKQAFNALHGHLNQARALAKVSSILEKASGRLVMKSFMKKARNLSAILKMKDSMALRRASLFLAMLRRKMIIKRIIKSFEDQRELILKRKVVIALAQNRETRLKRSSFVLVQVNQMLDQSQYGLIDRAFQAFKLNT